MVAEVLSFLCVIAVPVWGWVVILWPWKGTTSSLAERFHDHIAGVRGHAGIIALGTLGATVWVLFVDWRGWPTRWHPWYFDPEPLSDVLWRAPVYALVWLVVVISMPRRQQAAAPQPSSDVHQSGHLRLSARDRYDGRSGDVFVTVRDERGGLVRDAVVTIHVTHEGEPSITADGRTAEDGLVTFSDLPAGLARIVVSTPFTADASMRVGLERNRNLHADISIGTTAV